jgi:Domain of unknown function (DUF1924)
MGRLAIVLAIALCPAPLLADTPEQILDRYDEMAKQEDAAFAGFSLEHGHELYLQKRVLPVVGAINCASCHMADPREEIIAHKSKVLCRQCHVINDSEHPHPQDAKLRKIPPLAPSANPKRLTSFGHVEEFLKPNCEMVIGRECTIQEKGDIIAWLISLKRPDKSANAALTE